MLARRAATAPAHPAAAAAPMVRRRDAAGSGHTAPLASAARSFAEAPVYCCGPSGGGPGPHWGTSGAAQARGLASA